MTLIPNFDCSLQFFQHDLRMPFTGRIEHCQLLYGAIFSAIARADPWGYGAGAGVLLPNSSTLWLSPPQSVIHDTEDDRTSLISRTQRW